MQSILRLVAGRLGLGLVTLVVVSAIIFFAVEMLPGDIADAMLGQSATQETTDALRRELGLDRPAIVRYFDWILNAFQGNFGMSLATKRPIAELVGVRAWNTFFLAGYAAAIAVPLAVTLGILAALYRNSWFDKLASYSTLGAISFPEYFIAYVLLIIFSVHFGIFPSIAQVDPSTPFMTRLYVCFLPAMTLVLIVVAHMMRMTRAAIINLLAQPYIEMAHLKGAKQWWVIVLHALPNALAPIINVIAINLAFLIVGVVLVEVVFVYPGLGQLLVDSVAKRDVTIVQSACLIFAAVFITLNLLADVLAIVTNPRLIHPR
ncbi:ABC transporter permease [Leisingera thetidis]|uniref:ABC transporter permease n=1 Tax=Leisingera thetidis TaxID=2930199 RepID=UPI0021F71848|nr:ABC transporter permease [Leisingera thetidis]